jgi:hypothetical protein
MIRLSHASTLQLFFSFFDWRNFFASIGISLLRFFFTIFPIFHSILHSKFTFRLIFWYLDLISKEVKVNYSLDFLSSFINTYKMSCFVKCCKNYRQKCKKEGKSVEFHRFPVNPLVREEWIELCHRTSTDWKNSSRVCSDHFILNDYLDLDQSILLSTSKPSLKLEGERERESN